MKLRQARKILKHCRPTGNWGLFRRKLRDPIIPVGRFQRALNRYWKWVDHA